MECDKRDLMHNKKSRVKPPFQVLRNESVLCGNLAAVDAFETKARPGRQSPLIHGRLEIKPILRL